MLSSLFRLCLCLSLCIKIQLYPLSTPIPCVKIYHSSRTTTSEPKLTIRHGMWFNFEYSNLKDPVHYKWVTENCMSKQVDKTSFMNCISRDIEESAAEARSFYQLQNARMENGTRSFSDAIGEIGSLPDFKRQGSEHDLALQTRAEVKNNWSLSACLQGAHIVRFTSIFHFGKSSWVQLEHSARC